MVLKNQEITRENVGVKKGRYLFDRKDTLVVLRITLMKKGERGGGV
jgi:hypothetical protein